MDLPEYSAEHTPDINIYHGNIQAEGEAGYGMCRVFANSRQLLQLFHITGKMSAWAFNNLFGQPMQAEGAIVVTETGPLR